MKNQLLITSIMMSSICGISSLAAQTIIPFFPLEEIKSDLSLEGTAVDCENFVSPNNNFTLEVEGTEGVKITFFNKDNYGYEYTPETTTKVRFVSKNGILYVYEGNLYKGKLASVKNEVSFPEIDDNNVTTSEYQLIENASFETVGSMISDGKYNFGTPWETNITAGSIRVGTSPDAVNGNYVIVWRGSGNSNYFCQEINSLKSNTPYQIKLRQVASGNANALFNVGFGSTASGLEYCSKTVKLGNDAKEYTRQIEIVTPENIEGKSYFTFSNTSNNTASSGNDPVTQIDYISVVEGSWIGKSNSLEGANTALLVNNATYIPEGVKGDIIDYSTVIKNGNFQKGQSLIVSNKGEDIYTPEDWTLIEYSDATDGWDHSVVDNSISYVGTNSFRLRMRWGASRAMAFNQEIANMPAGKYEFKGFARTNDLRNSNALIFACNAANEEIGKSTESLKTSNEWQELTSTFTLLNNESLIIGGRCIGTNPEGYEARFWFDNFSLIYLGIDKSELESLVTNATSIYEKNKDLLDLNYLKTAIDQANSIIQNVEAGLVEISESEASLNEMIKKANKEIIIKEREIAWGKNNVDITELIINPDAENGNSGWTVNTMNATRSNETWDNTDASNLYFDGGNWGGSNWTSFMYQDLENLPNGSYTISAYVRNSENSTMHLFASEDMGETKITALFPNEGGVEGELYVKNPELYTGRGWASREVTIDIKNNRLQIGFEGNATTQHQWWSGDRFKLMYNGNQIPTDVLNIKDSTSIVRVKGNTISVEGVENYTIYNISGAIVAKCQGSESKEVAEGIYIVKAEGSVVKVMVK